jgi:hypothetical protein
VSSVSDAASALRLRRQELASKRSELEALLAARRAPLLQLLGAATLPQPVQVDGAGCGGPGGRLWTRSRDGVAAVAIAKFKRRANTGGGVHSRKGWQVPLTCLGPCGLPLGAPAAPISTADQGGRRRGHRKEARRAGRCAGQAAAG